MHYHYRLDYRFKPDGSCCGWILNDRLFRLFIYLKEPERDSGWYDFFTFDIAYFTYLISTHSLIPSIHSFYFFPFRITPTNYFLRHIIPNQPTPIFLYFLPTLTSSLYHLANTNPNSPTNKQLNHHHHNGLHGLQRIRPPRPPRPPRKNNLPRLSKLPQ